MDEPSESDAAILERIHKGDADAFELLIERYQRYVFAIVGKHLYGREAVEETAHDVFVEAFRSLKSYRAEADFRHWLARIAVRRCYAYWKARERKNREQSYCELSEDGRRWVQQALAVKALERFNGERQAVEAEELLRWAFARLQPEERMVLTLVHLEELSTKEAASLLGWSRVNVKVRAHRARAALRKVLQSLEE